MSPYFALISPLINSTLFTFISPQLRLCLTLTSSRFCVLLLFHPPPYFAIISPLLLHVKVYSNFTFISSALLKSPNPTASCPRLVSPEVVEKMFASVLNLPARAVQPSEGRVGCFCAGHFGSLLRVGALPLRGCLGLKCVFVCSGARARGPIHRFVLICSGF